MKKVVLAAVVLGTLSMVSCRKEWTCECTTTETVNDVSTVTVESTILNNMKPSQVDPACNNLAGVQSSENYSMSRTCDVTGLE